MADSAYQYIDSTGVILADTGDLLVTVQNEFKTSFGQDLIVTPDTRQGVLIVGETTSRVNVVNNNAAVANQINPNQAGGVFLDAICALLGLYREPATYTLVQFGLLGGVPGTVIPQGVQVKTGTSVLFVSQSSVTLDGSGIGYSDFLAVDSGPIPCAAGDIILPVDNILGWETVTNPLAGIPGVLQQSDASLRALRRITLALQGKSTPEAIISALNALPGVLSCTFRENVAAVTATIDGIVMTAKSIYVCVDGGADSDIALALLSNKTDGAAWNGTQTVTITDISSGQMYSVTFDRTTPIPILCRVTYRQGTFTGIAATAIPQAVLDYANGVLENMPGFVTGAAASPFEISSAVIDECAGIVISKVEITLASTVNYQPIEIAMTLKQKASVQLGSTTVVAL